MAVCNYWGSFKRRFRAPLETLGVLGCRGFGDSFCPSCEGLLASLQKVDPLSSQVSLKALSPHDSFSSSEIYFDQSPSQVGSL